MQERGYEHAIRFLIARRKNMFAEVSANRFHLHPSLVRLIRKRSFNQKRMRWIFGSLWINILNVSITSDGVSAW